jgi:GTPase
MELVDESLSEVQPFLPETDWGSIEYKRKLVGIAPHRRSQLITQMRWRLSEGKGSAEYNIGVDDDGTPNALTAEQYSESLETILGIAKDAGADAKKLHIRRYPPGIIFTLRIQLRSSDLDEYRWLIIGCSGVGKTTLAGCLLDGVVDDGKGSVRNRRLRHFHELDTGSSTQPLFSYKELEGCMLVLIDLPGGEKYLEDMIVRTLAYRPTGVIYVERPGQIGENPFKKLSVAIAQSGVPVLTAIMGSNESNSSSHIICQPSVAKGCSTLLSSIMDISKHAREPAWKGTFPPVCVIVCETMDSLELGLVAHGVVLSGSVRVGDCLQLAGTNIKVTINSVHRYKKPIACVDEDTSASFTFENNIANLSRLLHRGLLVSPGEVVKESIHKKHVYSANGLSMTSLIHPILGKDLEFIVNGEPHAPLPTSPETGIE